MRLLWINHFAVPPDAGGGTRHFELGRELVRRGWSVTVAASDLNLQSRRYTRRVDADDRTPIAETIEGVDFRWLWARPYERNDWRRLANWSSFAGSLLRAERSLPPADVVIGSSPHLLAALAGYRVARRRGVPFVLEVRDLWPESLQVGRRSGGPAVWTMRRMANFLYARADRIIVLAEGVEAYLARRGVAPERLVLVPNGASVADFGRAARPERDALRLVYAGAHGPANGLDTVLDAAAHLRDRPDISFLLVGDGPAKAELRTRAAAMGLANLEFRDPVPKQRMPELMAECDAGLMVLKEVPLFAFGVSPNKLFDYWGAALPVVNNVPGEVAAYVTRSDGGVQAEDGSGPALARAVERMAAVAPRDRAAMGARGRGWVLENRDRPVVAGVLDAALRELVQSTARAAGGAGAARRARAPVSSESP